MGKTFPIAPPSSRLGGMESGVRKALGIQVVWHGGRQVRHWGHSSSLPSSHSMVLPHEAEEDSALLKLERAASLCLNPSGSSG